MKRDLSVLNWAASSLGQNSWYHHHGCCCEHESLMLPRGFRSSLSNGWTTDPMLSATLASGRSISGKEQGPVKCVGMNYVVFYTQFRRFPH